MPIIETNIPDESALTQGDILRDINLYFTCNTWSDKGGPARRLPNCFSLVISRPCVVAHKKTILVCAIEKFTDGVPEEAKTLEERCAFLTELRDGSGSPDRFYLGHLPNEKTGRFYARLDSLHTIMLPEADNLVALLKKHRVARLSVDFSRDLHIRVFTAVASLGFDDHGWYSTEDLNWVVASGLVALQELTLDLSKKEAALAGFVAQGFKNPQQQANLEAEVQRVREKISAMKGILAPYEAESAKRKSPS